MSNKDIPSHLFHGIISNMVLFFYNRCVIYFWEPVPKTEREDFEVGNEQGGMIVLVSK